MARKRQLLSHPAHFLLILSSINKIASVPALDEDKEGEKDEVKGGPDRPTLQ